MRGREGARNGGDGGSDGGRDLHVVDEPEVVTSTDEDDSDDVFALVGVGEVGEEVAEDCARKGEGSWESGSPLEMEYGVGKRGARRERPWGVGWERGLGARLLFLEQFGGESTTSTVDSRY